MDKSFFVYILANKRNGTLMLASLTIWYGGYQNIGPSLFPASHANTNSTGWSILKRSIQYLKLARESIP
jgi:hypothetical protein